MAVTKKKKLWPSLANEGAFVADREAKLKAALPPFDRANAIQVAKEPPTIKELPSNKVETVIDPKTGQRNITIGGIPQPSISREQAEAYLGSNPPGFSQGGAIAPETRQVGLALEANRPGKQAAFSQEALAIEQQKQAALVGQIGQPVQGDVINQGNPLVNAGVTGVATGVAATGGMLAGAALGAKAGALIGTAVAPGVGTAVGAVVGFVSGALTAYLAKTNLSRGKTIKDAGSQFTKSQSGMRLIVRAANAGKIDRITAIENWNKEYADMLEAERYLKKESQKSTDKFTGNAGKQMIVINEFRDNEELYRQELINAITAPNPNQPLSQEDIDFMTSLTSEES